nr:DUF924 family protein [Oceanobacter mangrovi]
MEMYQAVLNFWFDEIEPRQWFYKDPHFDALLRERFGELHQQAAVGELWQWREQPEGRLAEVILLDQMSRNMFRDTRQAFAYDSLALVLAQQAVACGDDQQLPVVQRGFLYMPYMHSESMLIHQQALLLFDQPGLENRLHFEHLHCDIIARFGRYPHRNWILGRSSTEEEVAFLKQPGSSF